MRIGVSIADISTGQAAYAAILEALLRRGRSGEGSHIALSLFDTVAELMNVPYLTRRYGGIEPPRLGLAHPSIAPYGVFRLADGNVLLAVQSEREWQILAREVLRDEALATEPRFATNVLRVRNRAALDAAIQAILTARDFTEVTAALDKAAIAYGTVSSVGDLITHPAATTLPVETPAGDIEVLAPPAIVDGRRARMRRVPELGEHEAALRAEFAPAVARSDRSHGRDANRFPPPLAVGRVGVGGSAARAIRRQIAALWLSGPPPQPSPPQAGEGEASRPRLRETNAMSGQRPRRYPRSRRKALRRLSRRVLARARPRDGLSDRIRRGADRERLPLGADPGRPMAAPACRSRPPP